MKKYLGVAALAVFFATPAFANEPCGCYDNTNIQVIDGWKNVQVNVQLGDTNENGQQIDGSFNKQINVQLDDEVLNLFKKKSGPSRPRGR